MSISSACEPVASALTAAVIRAATSGDPLERSGPRRRKLRFGFPRLKDRDGAIVTFVGGAQLTHVKPYLSKSVAAWANLASVMR